MMRNLFRWGVGLALVVVVASVVARARNGPGGATAAPTIGGDTWPPVPLNPDRPV